MRLSDFLTAFAFAAGTAVLLMSIFYFGAVRFVELSSCGAC